MQSFDPSEECSDKSPINSRYLNANERSQPKQRTVSDVHLRARTCEYSIPWILEISEGVSFPGQELEEEEDIREGRKEGRKAWL